MAHTYSYSLSLDCDYHWNCFFLYLILPHISIAAATTALANSLCFKCGTLQKSGKLSCCGRGGSWYKKCGAAGNTEFDFTWHEGFQACKTRQFQAAVGQQHHTSADDVGMRINAEAVFVAARIFTPTPTKILSPLLGVTSVSVPVKTSKSAPLRKLTSKTNDMTTSLFINTSVLAPNSTIPRSNKTITPRANWTIIKSIHSDLGYISIPTSHSSATVSIFTLEYGKLIFIMIQISMNPIIFWWC